MIRAIEKDEIKRILRTEVVGRIGCCSGDRMYVVPVCYVYDDGFIYAHSTFGQKIEMMQRNPSVCFEVEHVENLVNWTSAICSGTYEELRGADAERGLRLLHAHLHDKLPRVFEHGEPVGEAAIGGDQAVVFRIRLTETSGREERLHWELLPAALRDGEPIAHPR
jgi:nitroimidazol reductase NimA-like FMN-containing flavoprotein (pyridoxamine 5'-phosphate oxidase superfamily)